MHEYLYVEDLFQVAGFDIFTVIVLTIPPIIIALEKWGIRAVTWDDVPSDMRTAHQCSQIRVFVVHTEILFILDFTGCTCVCPKCLIKALQIPTTYLIIALDNRIIQVIIFLFLHQKIHCGVPI